MLYNVYMKQLKALVELASRLSDDRLYEIALTPIKDNIVVGVGTFREGFLSEEVRQDIDEYIRHLARGGILVHDESRGVPIYTGGTQRWQDQPSATLTEHTFDIAMDRVEGDILGLRSCGIRISEHGMIFIVHEALVRPELVKEYNAENQRIGFKTKLWTPQRAPFMDIEE